MSDVCYVDIYHNGTNPFQEFTVGDVLKHQYEYQAGDGTSLNNVFRDNNVVDGHEYPVKHRSRSLSVGDGFVITTGYQSDFYVVGSWGFTKVTSREFYKGVTGWMTEAEEAEAKARADAPMFDAIGFINVNVEG